MQYDSADTAASFAALGFGREKTSIGSFVRDFVIDNRVNSIASSVAVVLGIGTGWELRLLKELGFSRIIGYEPSLDMLSKAKKLVTDYNLSGVELYDANHLDKLLRKWGGRAHFVLATHVIPALADRPSLFNHFLNYVTLLKVGGLALAITNNPQDQFFEHSTYRCHHFGRTVNDGDKILTYLKDVLIDKREIVDDGSKVFAIDDEPLVLEDTYWSDDMFREGIRNAGLILRAIHYIRLPSREEILAPYVAYSCRRSNTRSMGGPAGIAEDSRAT